MYDQTE